MASPEEEIKELKATIKELENRVGIQEDVTAIMNLMSNYELWHQVPKVAETWKLFAMKTPDVSAEICDWGVWEGPESIRKFYEVRHLLKNPDGSVMRGSLMEHHLTTYNIQVAKDRKTAKAVFWSPGHECAVFSEEKKWATWCWGRYGVDFIKEDGEWKIWHLKWYDVMKSDFYKSWQEPFELPVIEDVATRKDAAPPDKPCTYHNLYTVDAMIDVIPPVPEPYDTWDGKSEACGPRPE